MHGSYRGISVKARDDNLDGVPDERDFPVVAPLLGLQHLTTEQSFTHRTVQSPRVTPPFCLSDTAVLLRQLPPKLLNRKDATEEIRIERFHSIMILFDRKFK
jgi:hypothetical protein